MAVSISRPKLLRNLAAVALWLAVWEIAARATGSDILLVSPTAVAQRLVELVPQGGFWATVAYSLVRIAVGFAVALVLGTLLAWLASLGPWAKALIGLPMAVIRAVPVVSFIILVIIWAGSRSLTAVISGVMVLPLVYTNVEQGLARQDTKLLEFAQVFGLSRARRWRAITAPAMLGYLIAACRAGAGQAWKAGVSAEVIGQPTGSIGERLYQAKLYLSSADLFAWTAVIVALSFGFERLAREMLNRSQLALGRWPER